MVFKKDIRPLRPRGQVIKHAGKGSTSQTLDGGQKPTITPGNPLARTLNDYSKASPIGQPIPPVGGAPGSASPPDMGSPMDMTGTSGV